MRSRDKFAGKIPAIQWLFCCGDWVGRNWPEDVKPPEKMATNLDGTWLFADQRKCVKTEMWPHSAQVGSNVRTAIGHSGVSRSRSKSSSRMNPSAADDVLRRWAISSKACTLPSAMMQTRSENASASSRSCVE
jgi:hypothetical protein